MSRVKRGYKARRRRKKLIKHAKGYYGLKSKIIRRATEAIRKAWVYMYRDRRNRKRDFRSLWIARISAATRQNGLNYSRFMKGLKDNKIALDRKILSDIAIREPQDFLRLIELARSSLSS